MRRKQDEEGDKAESLFVPRGDSDNSVSPSSSGYVSPELAIQLVVISLTAIVVIKTVSPSFYATPVTVAPPSSYAPSSSSTTTTTTTTTAPPPPPLTNSRDIYGLPLPPKKYARDYTAWAPTHNFMVHMMGADFACDDLPGSTGGGVACQLQCEGNECGNVGEVCKTLEICAGFTVGSDRRSGTLKKVPKFSRDPLVFPEGDEFWDIWRRQQCQSHWENFAGDHSMFPALSDFFWGNKCYLYMHGDIVSEEISLRKRSTTSDSNDFLMGSKNPIVVDIGMHNADDSSYFLKRGARVSSVEADDALVEGASRHPTLLLAKKLGRFKLNHCAINHHQEGSMLPIQPEVIFYERPQNSEWNSLSDESCKRTNGGCKEAKTCAQIVLEATEDTNERVWYMKVDIEGADVMCLKSLEALPKEKRPLYVSTEDQKDGLNALEMESIGYDGFKLVAHHMNDKMGGYGGLPPEVLGEGSLPGADTWRTASEIRADGYFGGANNLVGNIQYDLFACMGCVNYN